ncbi:MAG: fibronectin type III domain-containing protein [Acidobacteriaceae bacterium]
MTQRDRTAKNCRWIALPLPLFATCFIAGCGAPAAPLPPTLNLPQPVRDLAAKRAGDAVHLTFSVPQKTTDKLPVRGPMTAQLCRSVESGPCQPAGTLTIAAQQKAAVMDDRLPPDLTQGPPRLLTYKVAILNHAAKSYGDSAPAYTAAGAAPPALPGFNATPRRSGIVLSWRANGLPPSPSRWIQFDRTRTSAAPPQPEPGGNSSRNLLPGGKTAEEPAEQILRLTESTVQHQGFAIDTTAHTGNSYRYVAQRIEQVTLAGRSFEIASLPSAPAETAYRDIFPPPAPTGLVSAADTAAKAIDLDWNPNVQSGVAGYIVYRRPVGVGNVVGKRVGENVQPQRISPASKPVTTSNWSDTTAVPGQRYGYSVSAVDASGNESPRSTEVEDQWNTPTAQPSSTPTPHP